MPTDHLATLTRLGLSDCEATMYLTLLAHGAQPVQVLARESKISRTAAYEVLETLQKRGLVTKKTDGAKWTFLAEDPEKLESYFAQRLSLFEAELQTLKRITPELRVQQGVQDTRPRVRYLSGYDGLRELFQDVERVEPHELLEFMDTDQMEAKIDRTKVAEARKGVNYGRTHVRFLYRSEKFVPFSKHTEHRKVSDVGTFRGNFWIYANRVVFLNYQDRIEIVVVDHHIFAETMRTLFEVAWNAATFVPVQA